MSPEREEYLRLKGIPQVHEMSPERREYLRMKSGQDSVMPSTDLSSMRFEPSPAPAVTTAVSPEYGQEPELHLGLLPKGTGEAFERALPQWPVTEGMGAGQKVLRTAGNLALGAVKFPVRMGTGILEEPLKVPQALAEFVPSVVNRISTALPGAGHRRFGAEFTGVEPSRPAEEDISQARRELMEEPFDVALLAAPLAKGLKAPRVKAPKPKVKAPVTEAVKPTKRITSQEIENNYIRFISDRELSHLKSRGTLPISKEGDINLISPKALGEALKIGAREGSKKHLVVIDRGAVESMISRPGDKGRLYTVVRGEISKNQIVSIRENVGAVKPKKTLVRPAIKPKVAKKPWEMTAEETQSVMHYKHLGEWDAARISRWHKRKIEEALSEGKLVPAEVLKNYPDLVKPTPKQIGVGEKGRVVGKKEVLKAKPTELGFMGVTPGGIKALGESTTKAMKSVSASTSQMIKEVKTPPAITRGAKIVKETLVEHDRQIRRSEATSALLKQTVKAEIPKADRQMLMTHAYEHKMKGKFWNQLNPAEKQLVRSLAGEKAKLNQFIKENKVLEMMPESERINHVFHHWIDPATKQPFKAMYGKFSKGLPQAKQRTIPTYEAGIAKGMKPATQNLGELIGLEWQAAIRAHQARQMIKSVHNIGADPKTNIKLTIKGKPRPIRMLERWDLLEKQGLTEGYTRYSHYALDKAITFKDASGSLVRLRGPVGVRNEIYPHLRAYMDNSTYSTFDKLNSVSRSAKLGLSMFHAVSLGAQEAALSLGKLVTGHPIAAARRMPFTTIPRGLRFRKALGPVERLLYQEGLELFKHSEQMGEGPFFKGVGIPSKAGNVITYPVRLGRDFIFGVVQPGMKTAFAHDTFLSMLPKYLKGTGWTKEQVLAAYDAGKAIPREALKAARQAVQMADGHFSGEHWRRSLLETNRFMAKAYFSPTARPAWSRGLLSPTWQREHMLVAKNVAKSFMPDRLINKMKLSEIHPAAKAEYRQYAYGAITIIGAVDAWNLMTTKQMDGKSLHLWENPEGKGFAVRAPWNEPDYTVTDKNGKTRTIKGGPAYIRPLKSLFEVAEWANDPWKKFANKLAPWLTAIIAQMPNNKYRNYKGMKDIPERTMDFMFDVYEPISIDQMIKVARGQKTPQAGILPFFGMPTSKIKEIRETKPIGVKPVRKGRIRPGVRR